MLSQKTHAAEPPSSPLRVDDAYLPPEPDTRLIPPPREFEPTEARFTLRADTPIVLRRDTPELRAAVATLQEDLETRYGWTLEVQTNEIQTGTADTGIVLQLVEDVPREAAPLPVSEAEGYTLEVTAQGVTITGADARGVFYGVQSLRQLLGVTPELAGVRLRDWPDLSWRVAMVYLDADSDAFNLKLLPILAKYKVNKVLVMSNYVQWESAPELHVPQGASKASARRLVARARELLIEPIPLLETFGHVQWMFTNNQNRDLLENPNFDNPFVYDALNPRVYEVTLPIVDELLELFEPRYFHIGHDEVRNVLPYPTLEEGRRVGFAQLFLKDTLRYHEHLEARGVRTMMWQDTLLSGEVERILDEFPKDIIVTSWHYIPAADYPTLTRLQEAGFEVLGASWDRPENISAMARAALERDALGAIQTRWSGYFGNSAVLYGAYPQVTAYLTAAAHFWHAGASVGNMAERFRSEWLAQPLGAAKPGTLVDLAPHANRTLSDTGEAVDGKSGWLGRGPDSDLSTLLEVEPRFAGVRFALGDVVALRGSHRRVEDDPERVDIPVGARAGSVAMLLTTGWSVPRFGTEIGRAVVHYEGGSQADIPLRYGRELIAWTDFESPTIELQLPWRGETGAGLPVAVSLTLWNNPHPERMIERLELVSADTLANPMLLGLTLVEEAVAPEELEDAPEEAEELEPEGVGTESSP